MFKDKNIFTAILIASFGYFIDIYDIFIFNVVRVPSITSLIGLSSKLNQEELKNILTPVGDSIQNTFLIGMLIGGVGWGILTDIKGRRFVLLSTILLYSMATILVGFSQNIFQYQTFRFISGLGLAGELGAGITLVNELVPKEQRSKVTMIVASVGLLGVVMAGLIGQLSLNWRIPYFIGGLLGIILFSLRYITGLRSNFSDSTIYLQQKLNSTFISHLKLLFLNKNNIRKIILCTLSGLALNITAVLIIAKTNEFSSFFGWNKDISPPQAGWAISICYIFIAFGDIFFAWLSTILNSRRKPIIYALLLQFFSILFFLVLKPKNPLIYYIFCSIIGFSLGYWSNSLANITEQFSSNIRGTATTLIPNLMRGTTVIVTLIFHFLIFNMNLDWILATIIIFSLSISIAIFSVLKLPDNININLANGI